MIRTKKRNHHEVIPSASRLAGTMRDVGYEFRTAVADLIDNSIAAGAKTVSVTMRFEGGASWIRIADDGDGMDADTLTEAMRYGSRRSYEDDELGKFGIGLKSASTSQCKRLTVASRTSGSQRRIHVRRWDLDDIEEHDQWMVEELAPEECEDHLLSPLDAAPGTVVLWEKLDRVLDYRFPDGESARKGFLVRAEELEKHLAMVFHRFLAGEAKRYRRKLAITINGAPVKPWDPFAREEKHTQRVGCEQFDVASQDGSGTVTFAGFVLPSRDKFSSQQAFEYLGGPERWNKQQGLYIYRNDRLIQSGGWSWLRTLDEHTKLARASINFSSKLDGAFKVNMAKERVTLPSELRDPLKPHIDKLIRRAQEAYRKSEDGGRSDPAPSSLSGSGGAADGRSRISGSQESARGGAETSRGPAGHHDSTPSAQDIRSSLEEIANEVDGAEALKRIVKGLGRRFPGVARALGY